MAISCSLCSQSFGTSQALQQHERDSPRHRSGPGEQAIPGQPTQQNQAPARPLTQPQFQCPTCPRWFKSNAALEQHQRDSPKHAGEVHQPEPIQTPPSNRAASTPQQRGPPKRPKPTFICEPCNRSFGSEDALEQHRRDSAAHPAGPTPLDVFFRSFRGFAYAPALPPAESYALLRQQQGWGRHSPASQEAWERYQAALRDELQLWYGAEDDLAAWHALCRAIGVHPLPGTCEQCLMAVRNTHVNIVDLIDWGRNNQKHAAGRVRTFRTVAELREYSMDTGKIFSNTLGKEEDGNVVMRHLLRKLFRGGVNLE